MRNVALTIGATSFALVAGPAHADVLAASVQWKDPSTVQLAVDFPGQGYEARWELSRCDCGDLLIRSELNEPGEAVHGDIVLVGNRAVLTRGFGKDAAELLSVDAPALMMQLALRLLERAEPGGPAAVVDRRDVAVEDRVNYINLETGTAVGGFPAPWSVSGTLWPAGDGVRRFDLEFVFNTGGAAGGEAQQGRMRLAGTADFSHQPFPLAADLALDDWTLGWRDPSDPLALLSESPATLGQLRQRLRETAP